MIFQILTAEFFHYFIISSCEVCWCIFKKVYKEWLLYINHPNYQCASFLLQVSTEETRINVQEWSGCWNSFKACQQNIIIIHGMHSLLNACKRIRFRNIFDSSTITAAVTGYIGEELLLQQRVVARVWVSLVFVVSGCHDICEGSLPYGDMKKAWKMNGPGKEKVVSRLRCCWYFRKESKEWKNPPLAFNTQIWLFSNNQPEVWIFP